MLHSDHKTLTNQPVTIISGLVLPCGFQIILWSREQAPFSLSRSLAVCQVSLVLQTITVSNRDSQGRACLVDKT